MLRRNIFFYFITPSDWHLDSPHTWMSMCKPFANYSAKHAIAHTHTEILRHSSTVVVCRETFVLWYCCFFLHLLSILRTELQAYIKATTICLFLSRFVSHTLLLSLSLSLYGPHVCAQTMHKLKHICVRICYGRDSTYSLITVHLTAHPVQNGVQKRLRFIFFDVEVLDFNIVVIFLFFDRLYYLSLNKWWDITRDIACS